MDEMDELESSQLQPAKISSNKELNETEHSQETKNESESKP